MADSDLDDELLALAGDESEQEQDNADGVAKSRTVSPSPASPPHPSIEKPSPTSPPRTSSTTKRMAKSMSRRKPDDSEEEGEASPPPDSPGSEGSAAMDESDSDEEAEPERPAAPAAASTIPYYPLEGRFRDAADRARIMGMSEMDRERILAEREEEILQAQQRAALQSLVGAADSAQAAKKRKAGAADLDDATRRATKAKTDRQDRLDKYKQARADRHTGPRQPTATRKARRSSTPESQRDADGESEVEFDEGYRAAPREQPVATAEEYQRLRIGRDQFAQYSCYPVFEELTTDAFVRVQVSEGRYRMAKIKGYVLGKHYRLDPPKAIPYVTDQHAELVAGDWTRKFPLDHCSNGRFTISEIEEYKRAEQEAGRRLPTSSWAHKKCEDLHALVAFNLSGPALTQKLNKQKRFQGELIKQTPQTVQKVDPRAEEKRLKAEANRKRYQEAQEAQKAARMQQRARERAAAMEAEKLRQTEEAKTKLLQIPKANVDDLFEGGSDFSRTGTPQPGDKKDAEKKKPVRETINGIPTFHRKTMDDEVIASIDLGIDIEI